MCVCVLYYKCARVLCVRKYCGFMLQAALWTNKLSFSVRRYYLKGGRELRNLGCVSSVRSASQF